jgi:putative transposase
LLLYKSVKQKFSPDAKTLALMETFRLMVNDCLRLGLDSVDVSYPSMKSICYPRMLQYPTETSYRISAIFEASNLVKKYRTDLKVRDARRPYCRNLFVSASVGVHIEGTGLVMPGGHRLQLNRYALGESSRAGVELVSATITPRSLGIVFRKEVTPVKPEGAVALDTNLENVTTYDTEGRSEVFGFPEIVQLHERYRRITSRMRRRDLRVRRALFRKYATIERNKKTSTLHNLSSLIVWKASAMKQAIVMEDLRGIRSMFRRESGSSASYLSKMNSWPFAELQRQIEYKAKWEGLPVVRIEPQGTSTNCSNCGGGMKEPPEEHPMLTCRGCGLVIDRDLNAAKNILSRALRSGAVGPANEGMIGSVSRGGTAPRLDAGHSSKSGTWAEGSEHC